jgi:tetratricopeptide (TPR) repeat protein
MRHPYAVRAALRSLLLWPLLAAPAAAGVESMDECRAAVAAAPEAAREEAAIWARSGGGLEARLCEAAALEAMGATATAARLIGALAENPNRAMERDLRATLFRDAARLWLDAGRPDLAGDYAAAADALAPPVADAQILEARTAAAQGDWDRAQAVLAALLDEAPNEARARALYAAALRRGGDPEAGRAEAERALSLAPSLPEAVFEAAAAAAELGNVEAARQRWLTLIELHPDHDLAPAARRNLQSLD